MRSTVSKDFYTNVAVAWFSAGVIAPFFVANPNYGGIFTTILSVTISLGFLSFARIAEKNNS